jgi:hypothetical protein
MRIVNPVVFITVVLGSSIGKEFQELTYLKDGDRHEAQTDAWNDDSWLLIVFKKLHIKGNDKSNQIDRQLRVEEFAGELKLEVYDIPCSVMLLDVAGVLSIKLEH